jgi:hypothetical protein
MQRYPYSSQYGTIASQGEFPVSTPNGDQISKVELGKALKGEEASFKARLFTAGFFTTRSLFLILGTFLFAFVSLVPIWNALSLLSDNNYIFWAGRETPQWMIIMCVSVVLLYPLTMALFFRRLDTANEQTIMMMATIFIALFGLFMVFVSSSLAGQSERTYINILYNCEYAVETHRLREYSMVLQNIRSQPDCAKKVSVEDCAGFEIAPPYTNFLKDMEKTFHCAGFCQKSNVQANSSKPALIAISQQSKNFDDTASIQGAMLHLQSAKSYPPTLFSDAGYQASCEGMAARSMKNFAGDIADQTFRLGLYLMLVSIVVGFLRIFGLCLHK